ncbi:MAG: hypothetical protein MJZ35_03635, partial [Bacteroidaceae bacterium]|nr:hypothetical protein [Bacteroidaceae bacterium]
MKNLFKSTLLMASLAMVAACSSNKGQATASADESGVTKSGLNVADFDTTYVDSLRGEKKVAL